MITALASLLFSNVSDASDLIPEREAEGFDSVPVDTSKIRYRPGKGVEFKSTDGRHSLALGFRGMFLYEVEQQGEAPATHQVLIRRARITASGSMWGKNNKYKVELAVSPRDESVNGDGFLRQTPLLTWQNTFTQLRDVNLRIGQYKIPYSWERVVSSSKLAMVDRSLANATFNLDRDIGFDIGSKDLGGLDLLQYNIGVYAGEGRGRFEPNDSGLMYLARVGVTPMGKFNSWEPQDFARGEPRLGLGVAYAFVDNPSGSKDILNASRDNAYEYHNFTADLVFKASGFSTEAAFFWRDGGETDRDIAQVGTGYYVQPALLIPHQPIGIALRWSQVLPADGGGLSEKTEVGPALSYYFAGARNHMKVQADFLRSWADDPSNGENQARLQLQAMF